MAAVDCLTPKLVNMKTTHENKFAPEYLKEIRQQVTAFYDRMNEISDYLSGVRGAPQLRKQDIYMQFYIDKTSLQALNEIADADGCESLVVLFGIHKEHLTGCFLGIDADKQILARHKKPLMGQAQLPGQENWPPPPEDTGYAAFTLHSERQDIIDFLS